MSSKPTIGIVIPTLNAAPYLERCLIPLLNSSLSPQILVVDSSSDDDTVKIAKKLGVAVMVVARSTFNHGLTREKARRYLGTDIAVMMTPDAYFKSPEMLETLIAPLIEKKASIAYARQLPHIGAGILEAFPRTFNYPEKGHIRSFKDINKYGVYTFFCSNSCAAYTKEALDSIGGFSSVILGEDTVAVAKILRKGGSVAYVAEAEVFHSHGYTLKQEFRRYFDTGRARRAYRDLIDCGEKEGKRGASFVRLLFLELLKKKPSLIPYAFLNTAAKWLGFRLGMMRG